MASKNFRFRKSFKLLGDFLGFTVSKKGVSLNLRAGFYSKSWGTRGTSTTIDMPGTSGMFWRRETGRKKLDPEGRALLRQQRSRQVGQMLGAAVIAIEALVELARLHVHLGDSVCTLSGHPHWVLGGLVAAQIAALRALRSRGAFVVLCASLIAALVQWKLFGALVMPNVDCV